MRGDRLLRRLARRLIPQAVILLYHRVAETDYDPQLLCVSPKHFADHMGILSTVFRPLSLGALSEIGLLELSPPRTVVVTFDDGYADNLRNAEPILQKYGIPATVFVTTDFVAGNRWPYWDELAALFLQAPTLPPRLTLELNGASRTWELAGESPVDSSWNVLQGGVLARQDAYRTLSDHLRSLTGYKRDEVLTEIRSWSGHVSRIPADLFMSPEELRSMTADGLMEIGAHTITHPNLALLPAEEQRREIVQGREQLEQISGCKVHSFAYPYGTRDHYTRDTVRIAKETGFNCACSNFPGTVWSRSDRYQLPRVLVRDWPAEEFARRLYEVFGLPG